MSKFARRPLHDEDDDYEIDDYEIDELEYEPDEDMPGAEFVESSPNRSHSRSPQGRNLYPDLSHLKKKEKPSLKKKEERKIQDTSKNSTAIPFLRGFRIWGFILLLIASIIGYLYSGQGELSKMEDIKQILDSAFIQDCEISKRVIKSALDKVVPPGKKPAHPAVILLLASNGATTVNRKLSACLAEHLDNKYLSLQGHDYGSKNSNSAGKLDDKIRNFLQGNQHPQVVLVEDLHRIHYEAASIFHVLCDDTNAPFKKAVFIMTAVSNKTVSCNAGSKMIDQLAEDVLNEAWQDWDAEKRSALLSRITISVAAVLPHISLSKCGS